MIDRVIQHAILQRLQPEWRALSRSELRAKRSKQFAHGARDATFRESSYGFRPGRSAHQAVATAQAHVAAGRQDVVDIDLAKFFDRVNHDRLMAKAAERIADKPVLRLIRAFLTAGAHDGGVLEESREGTPQGGPLSPLLSNLGRDELDRERERRGLTFGRYADDRNIYGARRKAAERAKRATGSERLRRSELRAEGMASVTRFIERRLKLTINEAKSAVDRPWNRTFLGFTLASRWLHAEGSGRISARHCRQVHCPIQGPGARPSAGSG